MEIRVLRYIALVYWTLNCWTDNKSHLFKQWHILFIVFVIIMFLFINNISLPLRNYRIVFNISVFVPLPTFSKCWMMLWFPSKFIMKCLNSPRHHFSAIGIRYLPVCVCEKLKLTCMRGADWGMNVQTIVKCQWCLHTIRPRNILFLHFSLNCLNSQ